MLLKIKPKATILTILSLFIVALALQTLPLLGLILALFATVPGIVLWCKSKPSFGIAAVGTVILTTILGNVFVLSLIIMILFMSFVVGQLLVERTTKERILYITTTFISLILIIGFMILQYIKVIPKTEVLIEPFKKEALKMFESVQIASDNKHMLEEFFRQLSVQIPSYIIVVVFIFVLINLLVTFPLVRKFKVATPVFKPLYAWQMKRSLIWVYFVVLLCVMFMVNPSPLQSIVLNFNVVLELIMFIQGLSVIHFFGKVKRMPNIGTVGLMLLGVAISPFLPIINLLGMLDLGINLKRMIKK